MQEKDCIKSMVNQDQSAIKMLSFNGTAVRVVECNDNSVWFVGKDVCEQLGYTNHRKAMNDHCRGVTIRYPIADNLGRMQEVRLLSECDVMRLICSSQLPDAVRFERWVFEEVLPSIRKHGGYIAANSDMTDDEIMARALQVAQKTIDRKNMLIEQQAAQIDEQRKQLELQAPDADYCRKVLACETLITTNIVAGHLGISAKRLNQFLDYEGWIYRQGKTWCASQKIRSKNFCDYATYIYTDEYGHEQSSHLLKWTESGRKAVIELWNKRHNSGKGA